MSVAVGILLVVEALLSPIVYGVVFIVDAFVSVGDGHTPYHPWLGVMARLGNAGVLLLLVPLAGSAVVVFVRPRRARVVAFAVCAAAAILNVLVAIALLFYNVASSTGPVVSRVVGFVFGLAFAFVAVWVLMEAKGLLAPRVAFDGLPPPPP